MRKQRIFWGLFFIAIAAVMIANQLGMLGGFSMMQLVLGMLFAAMLVKARFIEASAVCCLRRLV